MLHKSKLYLLAPLLIIAGVIAADRVFMIPAIHRWIVIWKKIEPPLYQSRDDLFHQLLERYPDYKRDHNGVGLILGTSRSAEFSNDEIMKHGGPVTYNFSAPLAPPSFYDYWSSRILDENIDIRFLLIEADPLIFTNRAIDYSLGYSYDANFILRNLDLFRDRPKEPWTYDDTGFSFDEAETFFLKRIFSLYRYPLDIKTIKENGKELYMPNSAVGFIVVKNIEFKDYMIAQIEKVNREKLGGIPNVLSFDKSLVNLDSDAKNTYQNMGLVSFSPSLTQISFFKQLMEKAAEKNIPTIVYWPVISDPLQNLMDQNADLGEFRTGMVNYLKDIKKRNPSSCIAFSDYTRSDELKCRNFADSYHLSGKCFEDLTKLLYRDIKRCRGPQL